MHSTEISTKEKIIEAGKYEFLEKGYEKASLRNICSKAKVTTGALYFSFKNKSDLFNNIVKVTVTELNLLIQHMVQLELKDISTGCENEAKLMRFLWEHRDEVLILLNKSEGTPYEKCKETFTKQIESAFILFFQKSNIPIDVDLIHILVCMKIEGYIEILSGGYTMEKSVQLATLMGSYSEYGFEKLIEEIKEM
ncbi:TetR/AcrR family transcriptional regulator [Clostridium niameyense]|uniref:TetR/AcrR family transcriptional regulator n=1 Tax=Clostridium niameyense TaxID=1622073 RepID=A0A6M0RA18_9CLOT|nr:TetR/AcrR family transcriptional regulator [Clostridium niameyense]NEZ46449.1 TetR/AcrR family transcriptional regulator [Clostridium niameyense]